MSSDFGKKVFGAKVACSCGWPGFLLMTALLHPSPSGTAELFPRRPHEDVHTSGLTLTHPGISPRPTLAHTVAAVSLMFNAAAVIAAPRGWACASPGARSRLGG